MDLTKLSKVADSHKVMRILRKRIKDSVDLNSVGFYEKLNPEVLNSAVYATDYHHDTILIKTKSVGWLQGKWRLDYLVLATPEELPKRVKEIYEWYKEIDEEDSLPDWDGEDTSYDTLISILEDIFQDVLVLEPGLWMVTDEIGLEAYEITCMADWFKETIENFTIEESANISIDTLRRWLEEADGDERENLEWYIENNYEELNDSAHNHVVRTSKKRISDSESEPDYTNEVIYKLKFKGGGYLTEVDDNVLYLYEESNDQPRGQLWIDKFGEIHIEDFTNDEPLTADEREILENLATKAKGKYKNGYTKAKISLWAIEHEFTTPHVIENIEGVWTLTFNGEPTDAEVKLLKRHKIEFDEDWEEWA